MYPKSPKRPVLDPLSILRDVNRSLFQTNDQAKEIIEIEHTISPFVNENVLLADKSIPRTRRKKANSFSWECNVNKEKRMKGLPYVKNKKPLKTQSTDDGKIALLEISPPREIGPRCGHQENIVKRSPTKLDCHQISEHERLNMFTLFWTTLDWGQRKIYINSLVRVSASASQSSNSRRLVSYQYYLKTDFKDIQVCKVLFLSTFNIGEKTVEGWVKNSSYRLPIQIKDIHRSPTNEKKDFLCTFFESLPKVPSHYCRQSTTKSYLEPIISSKAQLFNLYLSTCTKESQNTLSIWSFNQVFDEKNLSLFRPKKDQCELCLSYEAGNTTAEEKSFHDLKKVLARDEKSVDKTLAKKNLAHVFTVDLQSLQQSPVSNASCMYFKCKLNVHNYTIYNLGDCSAVCYWWDESEGNLNSSVFISCLLDHLESLSTGIPVIIWSDGCTYQNRNSALSNALLNFSMKTGTILYQKYLEKGHTQMECDSVHSTIERRLRNKTINLPTDYINLTETARRDNPYEAKFLSHTFFKNYTIASGQRVSSIRPGTKVGDPVVVDIRAIKYDPSGKIFYKLKHGEDDWIELPKKIKQIPVVTEYPPLYTEQIKITKRKWSDLQDLKEVVPAYCHSFYDNLSHL